MVVAKLILKPSVTACAMWVVMLAAGCSTTPFHAGPMTSPSNGVPESVQLPAPDIPTTRYPPNNSGTSDATFGAAHAGDEIALRALALVGKPYRYGGADLNGFDCSGLVFFIYRQLGMDVPRTAQDQQRAAARVSRQALEPGDLVFFKLQRHAAVSHVGIYVGDNRFVHAPQSGKLIELRALDDQYFSSRWVSAGRFDSNL